MDKCPFSSAYTGTRCECMEEKCKMWHNEDCLIKTFLIQATSSSVIIPNDTDDEEIEAKIEKLKKQNEMLSMGFSIF